MDPLQGGGPTWDVIVLGHFAFDGAKVPRNMFEFPQIATIFIKNISENLKMISWSKNRKLCSRLESRCITKKS